MYKISVIIPVYNVENTISKAFDSIYNQSIDFQDIEVIFVDDCSTDNSFNIIQDYASKYDNVLALSLEENSLQSATFTLGIADATFMKPFINVCFSIHPLFNAFH